MLCTVIKGHSPPSYVQHPLAIAVQPGLRAIVEAWQKEVLAWRTGLFTEAMNEWADADRSDDPELNPSARLDELGVAELALDRLRQPRRDRDARHALLAVGALYGLRPSQQLQYARELDVLNWLSALSLRRTEEDKLFGLDSGAQVRDIQRVQEASDYALLAVTFNAFSKIFVRLVKQNENEQLVTLLTQALQNPAFDRPHDLTAKLRDAKLRIAAAFEAYSGPSLTDAGQGADLLPASVLRAFAILESTQALNQQARKQRQDEANAQVKAVRQLKRLDAFLGKLKRTNATLRKTAAYTGNLINWIERERRQQPGPASEDDALTTARRDLAQSLRISEDYSRRAIQLTRFVKAVRDNAARNCWSSSSAGGGSAPAPAPRPRPRPRPTTTSPRRVAQRRDAGPQQRRLCRRRGRLRGLRAARAGARRRGRCGRGPVPTLGRMDKTAGGRAARPGDCAARPRGRAGASAEVSDLENLAAEYQHEFAGLEEGDLGIDLDEAMEMIDASAEVATARAAGWDSVRELYGLGPTKGAEKSARAAADAALDRADDEVEAALASVRETAERSAKSLVSSLLGLRQEERSVEIVTGAVLALPPPNVTLESINGELATVQVDPAGMTWDAYRALRAQDPAANDADANEAAAYGTNGWRGSYRRYVADAVQVATVDGDDRTLRYRLDALPMSPMQWLSSELSEGPHAAPLAEAAPRARLELEGLGADSLEDLGLDEMAKRIDGEPRTFSQLKALVDAGARRRPTRRGAARAVGLSRTPSAAAGPGRRHSAPVAARCAWVHALLLSEVSVLGIANDHGRRRGRAVGTHVALLGRRGGAVGDGARGAGPLGVDGPGLCGRARRRERGL